MSFIATCAVASTALAQRVVTEAVTPVIRINVNLGPGIHTIRTANLSGGWLPDPMMHIWGERYAASAYFGIGEVTRCDDDDGLNPVCTFTRPSSAGYADYTVVVHAYDYTRYGVADVLVDGAPIATGQQFAGRQISLNGWGPGDLLANGPYNYEVALPAGTTRLQDTFLYGFNGWELRAMDDDSGVGWNSRLFNAGGVDFTRLMVSSYGSSPPSDPVNVYANDVLADTDGDGLGPELEAALGTCDSETTSPSCADPTLCPELNLPPTSRNADLLKRCWRDRDRDGLEDNWEVFGVEDTFSYAHPQHLQAWGADPRIKDAFAEIDWHDAYGGASPILESTMASVASAYEPPTLPPGVSLASVLHHGGVGVRLHFDIGTDCVNKTLCGNWGGSTAVLSVEPESERPTSFQEVRKGLFRYVVAASSYAGAANVQWDTVGYGDANNRSTLTHEMGHSLGLEHWGHNGWGPANCKPHYTSIMNYEGGYSDFSLGLHPEVLDPANLTEIGAYAAFTHDPEPYLVRAPSFRFDWYAASRSVDWNFDGILQPFAVRANPRQVVNAQGECQENELKWQSLQMSKALDMKLMRIRNFMFAFWRTPDNSIRYSYAVTAGADDKGSCITHEGATLAPTTYEQQAGCLFWSSPQIFTQGVLGFSAAAFETAGDNTIVVAYRSPYTTWVRVVRVAPDGSFSNVTDPQPLDVPPTMDVELSALHVDPARFDGSSKVVAMFIGASPPASYQWRTLRTPAGTWVNEGDLPGPVSSVPAQSVMRASVIPWPDPNETYGSEYAGGCGVFPFATQLKPTIVKPSVYCYDKSTNVWRMLNGGTCLLNDGGTCVSSPPLTAAAAIAFHVPRRVDGAPVQDGVGNLWFMLPTEPDLDGRFYRSVTISAGAAPWTTANSNRFSPFNKFQEYGQNGPIALYEDRTLSALRGMYSVNDKEGNSYTYFQPFVDGTFRSELRDGNDFSVMERSLCQGLRARYGDGAAFCGRAYPGGL